MKYTYQITDLNEPSAFDGENGIGYESIGEAMGAAIETIHDDFSDEVIRTADIEVSVYTEDDDGFIGDLAVSFTINDFRRALV